MSIWLDFLQVALALGIGWVALVMVTLARPIGLTSAHSRRRARALVVQTRQPLLSARATDRDR